MINYGKQTIDEEDIKEIIDVLKSDFLTTGPKVKEFEEKFAQYVGSKYAIVVSSGTAALHLACLASGLKQGDELITSPMTFVASANCALYCNAKPIFVDIKKNGLIDENLIEKNINSNTKILIPVHYSGLPCEMKKIKEIADKHNLIIIEDACHALGARYKDSKIGDCKYSNMSVFSFHPVKHITTGEGGMITTNSKEIYDKLICLRNHGFANQEKIENTTEGSWYREIHQLGYNYRITDIQCALGLSQLKKISHFIEKRREIAEKYNKTFENNEEIEIIKEKERIFNSYHLYIIKLKNKEKRLKLFNYLKENKIFCQVHYIPVYWHPLYQKLGYKKGLCPTAEEFYEKIISLPIYPSLKETEQELVIKKIKCEMMKNTEQIEFWKGEFGDEYINRNSRDFDIHYKELFGITRSELNKEFLGTIRKNIKILEVGCNRGKQIEKLQQNGFNNLWAIEINKKALSIAKENTAYNIVEGSAQNIPFKNDFFDVVTTNGVLIHIAPKDLPKVIEEIYRVSKKYIWCMEYFSDECQEITYRGHKNRLWKNDFLKLFLEKYPNLKIIKKRKLKELNERKNNMDMMFLLEK